MAQKGAQKWSSWSLLSMLVLTVPCRMTHSDSSDDRQLWQLWRGQQPMLARAHLRSDGVAAPSWTRPQLSASMCTCQLFCV